MPQDRRTRKFKQDRQERLEDPTPLGMPITEDLVIPEAKDHQVTPDKCIWCEFPLQKLKAICPHCKNCQSCGLLQPAGGLERCFLCGNHVPEKRIQHEVPTYRTKRGHGGFRVRLSPGPGHKRGKGMKAP